MPRLCLYERDCCTLFSSCLGSRMASSKAAHRVHDHPEIVHKERSTLTSSYESRIAGTISRITSGLQWSPSSRGRNPFIQASYFLRPISTDDVEARVDDKKDNVVQKSDHHSQARYPSNLLNALDLRDS